MKILVWILCTCLRDEGRPCLPEIYTSEEAAVKAFDAYMREEWKVNAPEDDHGTQLDYPGEAGEAMRQMRAWKGPDFEEWEITKHTIDVSLDPPLGPIGVVVEGGVVQGVVSSDTRLTDTNAVVIDYDTDGVEHTYSVPQIPATDHVPRAELYDTQVQMATGIDFDDLWRRFCTVGPDHVEVEQAA